MKIIQIVFVFVLILGGLKSYPQDMLFSQFWNTPLLNNPSFAGGAEDDIRAIINHRSQGGNVTSNPFKTSGANFDMRINSSKDNYFGGGIFIYTDVAGVSKMRTTWGGLSMAYHIRINNRSYFSGGLNAGIDQKSIQDNELRFDNQFDGVGHNPGINSNESFDNLTTLNATVSGGVSYRWSSNTSDKNNNKQTIAGEKSMNFGIAVHHFNAPRFYFIEQERLGLKFTGNFEGSFNISTSPFTMQPAALMGIQNKATTFTIGSLLKYNFNENTSVTDSNREVSIGVGGYYRFQDAIIPTFQLEWAFISLGISYHAYTSERGKANLFSGGFEISLTYMSFLLGDKSRARYSY